MTVQTSNKVYAMGGAGLLSGGTLAFVFLLLPVSSRTRRKAKYLRGLSVAILLTTTAAMSVMLTGCGGSSGFFGQAQKTYTIQVTATATGSMGATLTHAATVQMVIE
jgi:hypothetical protein